MLGQHQVCSTLYPACCSALHKPLLHAESVPDVETPLSTAKGIVLNT